MTVTFYNNTDILSQDIKYAVIITKYQNKWLFCRHQSRETWEIPGGTREKGETIIETARRELYEETGATKYTLEKCFVFEANGSYACVFFADVEVLEDLPISEIAEIQCVDEIDFEWTYPNIQPEIFEYYLHTTRSDNKND
ncbi:MAG: NUDIX domain-containing protein [Erysipelothrix sp.]